jgi:hypothetical protein
MPSAAYYRMLAQECYQLSHQVRDAEKARRMRKRGREYSELAEAQDRTLSSHGTKPRGMSRQGTSVRRGWRAFP